VDIVDGRDDRARGNKGRDVLHMQKVNPMGNASMRQQRSRVKPAGKARQANEAEVGWQGKRKVARSVGEQDEFVRQSHAGKLPQQVEQVSAVTRVRSEEHPCVYPDAHGKESLARC
jgi:hypothetical protein